MGHNPPGYFDAVPEVRFLGLKRLIANPRLVMRIKVENTRYHVEELKDKVTNKLNK